MAQADYVWTLGDDDMLTRDALKTISKLLIKKKKEESIITLLILIT